MAETRPPSPARLRRALEAGDTPLSGFAVRAASLCVVVLVLPGLCRATATRFGAALRAGLAAPESVSPTSFAADVVTLVAPALVAAAAAALIAGMAQTGRVVVPRPAARTGRLFDALRVHDAARALLVAFAVVALGWRALSSELPALGYAVGHATALLDVAGRMALGIVWPALGIVAAFALADVIVRRAVWLRRLSPSPEQAARERRESEGDPLIRAARRREHERLLR